MDNPSHLEKKHHHPQKKPSGLELYRLNLEKGPFDREKMPFYLKKGLVQLAKVGLFLQIKSFYLEKNPQKRAMFGQQPRGR